jgi:G3E family GTPase
MKVHLVGGFLGSGKTTAITNASVKLRDAGTIAGVVTNDQGNYLVDSRFIDSNAIPSGEVTGGCFCCNFNDLDKQIQILLNAEHPAVIFAESVGSCTDLVATVLRPLIKFRNDEIESFTLSIFADARLLLKYLQHENLNFSDEISYIFEKQIEEANILVANKIDLLQPHQLQELKILATVSFPDKLILYQNSLDFESLDQWLQTIDHYDRGAVHKTIDIDYQIYGKGEAHLAWLDEEIEINGSGAWHEAISIIEKIKCKLDEQRLNIGHLKFLISNIKRSDKVSFTSVPAHDWKAGLVPLEGEKIILMVNARVETNPGNLRNIVYEIVSDAGRKPSISIQEHCVSAFQPGFPSPTYRMAE